ncbi:serpin (serine protease inhibitor) domain-containing protein [Phthorimaea operculella]|nr:serpin (serine protease inhibitor) domain-containing protein [Phthorimaea operculella]
MKLFLITTIMATAAMAEYNALKQTLQQGNNRFTANMFSEVVKANPGKSVVMSGFSVLTPLAQLALASEGHSHDELMTAIGMKNNSEIKDVFGYVKKNLRSVKGVELKMASRIYVGQEFTIDDHFQDLSRDLFGSEVKQVDFAQNGQTASDINNWAKYQTNNKITGLVDPDSINEETRCILVNAIYFKGKWEVEFGKWNTKDEDFYVTKEKTVKVPMMHSTGPYRHSYNQELDAQLLRLPYQGGEASMLIILPNKIDGLAALEENLKDPDVISRGTQRMFMKQVIVSLPKFKIETTTDLKDVLQKMDVKDVFTKNNANLTHLFIEQRNFTISAARQKAFIEVNEEGAEAAAVNSFDVFLPMPSMLPPPPPAQFIADRPFYYQIEVKSVTIFSGVAVSL